MLGSRRHDDKIDPDHADYWRYACESCGTPFRRNVSACGDCGAVTVVPIGQLSDRA